MTGTSLVISHDVEGMLGLFVVSCRNNAGLCAWFDSRVSQWSNMKLTRGNGVACKFLECVVMEERSAMAAWESLIMY